MSEVNPLLNSTLAGQIAQKLDAKDGNKDGKISASIWNEFVAGKGGKEINEFIDVEQAMKSITTYAVRSGTNEKSADSLAGEWLETAGGAEGSNNTTGADDADGAGNTQGTGNTEAADDAEGTVNTQGAADKKPKTDPQKEAAAEQMGLRKTYRSDFYYSETEKMHYKWDKKKKQFVKYPNIDFVNKDGSYRRSYKNSDGSKRIINYSSDGYPTSMQARNYQNKSYTNKDGAAKKLGLRKTYGENIYYDEKTKKHYEWNKEKHTFDIRTDIKYVGRDGVAYDKTVKIVKNKKGQVIKESVQSSDTYYDSKGNKTKEVYKDENGKVTDTYEYAYDSQGNLTKKVHKGSQGKVIGSWEGFYDSQGKVTGSWEYSYDSQVEVSYEYTYDSQGNKTKEVKKDSQGKVKKSYEYTYDSQGNLTKKVWKDSQGKVKESYEYTYDSQGNKTKEVWKDSQGKVKESYENSYDSQGNLTKSVKKDSQGKVTASWEYSYDSQGAWTKTVHKRNDSEGVWEYYPDSQGAWTKTVHKGANGAIIKRAEVVDGEWCFYDGKGNEISAEEFH